MKQNVDNESHLKDLLEIYISKWLWIALGVMIAVSLAFIYLRYATYQYDIRATIKLSNQEDTESLKKLKAIQDYGLFTQNRTKILDEIEVIRSTDLMTKIVDDLNLNLQYFVEGNINKLEVYKNPPINVSFFESDSVINTIDTSFTIKVLSKTEFSFEDDNDTNDNETHEFGTKLNSSFGGVLITPDFQNKRLKIGDVITVKMRNLTEAVENLKGRVGVSPANDNSDILKLSIKDPVKEKGEDILNTLIKKYNQSVVDDKLAVVKNTSDFINERLQAVSSELSDVDLTAENIQKSNRLTDLAVQSSLYLKSERETEAKLVETSTQLELVNYMADYLDDKGGVGELIPSNIGISDNTFNETSKKINELVQQRNRILKNSTEKNPTIVNLDNQISDLRGSLNQSLNNIKSSNQIRLNALNEEDKRLGGRIYSAPKKARQSKALQRQQNIKESLYLYLLEKREESAISLGITTPNAKIIDNAYSSVYPVTPRKSITLLAALVLGGLIPIVLIYLLDLFNTKVRSKIDITNKIDAPFLGDIPKSSKKQRLVKKVDYSPKAEAFRLIRTNIDFMLANVAEKRAKIVFVTSTTSQEGNHKLKIDEVITTHPENPNLHIISSGTIPPNPAELLMSNRMQSLFDQVSNIYDYVIVDTAAVGLVTDTLHIAKYADMFVYVVRVGRLEKNQLHVAETMYREKRLPNMAILLNDVKMRRGYGDSEAKKPWYKFAKS